MKNPFNIFPRIAYKNSQFQIISTVDNLKIDIYDQEKIVKSIETTSKNPILITHIESIGRLIAKCNYNNEEFQLEIEIIDAIRLGSSEFKKAFLFDDTEYSFFLMNDRLLLFDEKNKYLFTENHYSPTEIHKINKTKYLFVTQIGSSTNGITNLGIYDTETFFIVNELLNEYQEIQTLPESNTAWLFNIKLKTIHCFELVNENNTSFNELIKYEGFTDYFVDNSSKSIFINFSDKVIVSNLTCLHNSIEIPKLSNNAIDKSGIVYTIEGDCLTCTKCLTKYYVQVKTAFKINLQPENFIHFGDELKQKNELLDLNKAVDELKDNVITSIPHNKTFLNYLLSDSQKKSETIISHKIYPAVDGIFIICKEETREFYGIKFSKNQNSWSARPNTYNRTKYSILYVSSNTTEILLDNVPFLRIEEYHNLLLYINTSKNKILLSRNNIFSLENESSLQLLTVNDNSYFVIKSGNEYSLYQSRNFKNPLLDGVEIVNSDLIQKHQIIWYRGKEKYISNTKYLNAFDLKCCSKILIDEQKIQQSQFKDASDVMFYDSYAISSNKVVFSPINLQVKDSVIGIIEFYSKHLNKIASCRDNVIYLSVFNDQIQKFEMSEIELDDHKYKQSFLSPNGQFLVLQDETNKYSWYDIEKNETIKYFSGIFLAFRNDGSLIIDEKEDNRRSVKIFDPKTFQDITPSNYKYYQFLSPDGKLYTDLTVKLKYHNRLNGKQLGIEEVNKLKRDLDSSDDDSKKSESDIEYQKIRQNRLSLFMSYKHDFEKLGVYEFDAVTTQKIINIEKIVTIGLVGTSTVVEITLPEDTDFYNYAAFSYDNKFIGIVGKPYKESINKSLIMICSLSIDYNQNKIEIIDTIVCRLAKKACWVSGFSKSGYFATYDSEPDSYLFYVDDIFKNKQSEIELQCKMKKEMNNSCFSCNIWNKIKGKNFLCFGPSGNLLALSEQGYEPLTLGGYGHQESNVVHIADTKTGKILTSYLDHGTQLVNPKNKDTIFVSFSEDEKRIMSLSKDGVVIIREISVKTNEDEAKAPVAAISILS